MAPTRPSWMCLVSAFLIVLLGCSSGTDVSGAAVSAELPDASAADAQEHDVLPSPHEETRGETSPASEDSRPDLPDDASKLDEGGDVADASSADVADADVVDGEAETPFSFLCPGTGPSGCNEHGTCDTKVGICSCYPLYDGVACDKCKPDYDGYPACKPACVLLSHVHGAYSTISYDTVKLGPATKMVPVYCPENPDCVGGFHEDKAFASLSFAPPGCSTGKFVYAGKWRFLCASKLTAPAAIRVTFEINKAVYWPCPDSSVKYAPLTGDLSVDCTVDFKSHGGLPPPYVMNILVELLNEKGYWYGLIPPYPSPICTP